MTEAEALELIKAEISWLGAVVVQIENRARELDELLPTLTSQGGKGEAALEQRLEGLAWTEARSKKCDYAKDCPADLVAAVRAFSKSGFRTSSHVYTAASGENTLFRFDRAAS